MSARPPKPPSSTDQPPQVLHAPWRDSYLQSLGDKEKADRAGASPAPAPAACFLTEYWTHPEHDERNLIVARVGEGALAGMILLNRYPYANGHLLVALGEARPRLLDYAPEQRAALWRLTDLATDIVERSLEPQGVNVGLNQGRAAGAGVPEHVHVHVVPRWHGDVNFMTVVGRVRVNPAALEDVAARFRATWRTMCEASA